MDCHIENTYYINWYNFLARCMDKQDIFKHLNLVVTDMWVLLDIEILKEHYYADSVWKHSRKMSDTYKQEYIDGSRIDKLIKKTYAVLYKKR